MDLKIVIKLRFFTFIYAVFQSQSTVEILLLSLSENERTPYGNSTPCFYFELFVVIGMRFCTDVPNCIRIRWSATELWRYVGFRRWRT